ncbi:TIGR03757 family integrating conjugative element protein [Comamonas sp.]|uniref:TIGR03757 family integrating conjugative element protein n=1 Tax=Comamonas sp. TaxID=34028 RepID=UPI002584DAFF|nr:TIGR03757 family integrating conjugative element protein [Comamonas sp.]
MKCFALPLVAAAMAGLANAAQLPQPTTVEVFANMATLVAVPQTPAYKLQVYRLDVMALIEHQLSQGLPAVETDALAHLQRMEAQIRRKYQAQIVNAANGMTMAIHYKLDRLPAVVINRQAVIYGVPDVDKALAIYQQQSGARP